MSISRFSIRDWFICFIIGFFTILTPFSNVRAGVTGDEGGVVVASTYTISSGGSVKMYLYKSADVVIIGSPLVESRTVQGPATGQYPSSMDIGGASIAQGAVALDRIEITPAQNYVVERLTVNGADKGAVTSYSFGGAQATFSVDFASVPVATPTPEVVVPVSTPVPIPTSTPIASSRPTSTPKTVATAVPTTAAPVVDTSTATPTPEVVAPIESEDVALIPAGIEVNTVQTSTGKRSIFSYWWFWLLLIILLLLLILFLILFYKKKKKKGEEEGEEGAAQK